MEGNNSNGTSTTSTNGNNSSNNNNNSKIKCKFKYVWLLWRHIKKSYIIRQAIVLLQVLVLFYLISQTVIKFQMLDNKTTIKEFNNNECSTLPTSDDCARVGYNFSRVLFFYNDGLARDLSDDLVNMFKSHSNTFRIQNEGFPASYAVFSSYVTGAPPTNFMGNPILSDNIIYQLAHNNITLRYYGTRMPAYDVLEKGQYFDRAEIEYVSNTDSKLYTNLFECGKGAEACSTEFLEKQKSANMSIFFSGDIIDERNHHTGNKLDPVTLETINTWISNMKYIKNWIDANPEYLLVIFSDHGGKLLSETAAHGGNNDGNEAFMIIYNPTLTPLPNEQQDIFIDQVDVCATVWQHFAGAGVSLPIENIGKVYPTTTDPEKIYQTLKLNADQLNRFGHHWGYKMKQSDFTRAIDLHKTDIQESIKLFTKYINSLKIPFLNLKRFPWFEVTMYPILIALLATSLLYRQYGSFTNLGLQLKSHFTLVFIPYLIIIGITGLFSGFWVLYWHDDNESIHMFVASLLSTLAIHYSSFGMNIEFSPTNIINASNSGLDENDNVLNNGNGNVEMDQLRSPLLSVGASITPSLIPANDNDFFLNGNNNNTAYLTSSGGSSGNNSMNNSGNSVNNSHNNSNNNSNNNSPLSSPNSLSSSNTDDLYSISTNQPLSIDYKKPSNWIIIYAFFCFFMAVFLFLLTIPLEDLLLVHLYEKSWLIATFFLVLEYIIQKRRIMAHFSGGEKNNNKPPRGIFYPLYLKFAIYLFILFAVYYYDKQWLTHHVMEKHLAFTIYFILGVHALILLFSNRFNQADIILPISMTLYFLSNNKERFYLTLFVIPQLYAISNVFYYKLFNVLSPIIKQYRQKSLRSIAASKTNYQIFKYSLKNINFFSGITDHFLPFVVLLMTTIALSCYKLMKMNFQIGDVAIYVPGIFDPPTTPVFSGFIMAFHKLGYFFLLGGFLIKLANPCPPAIFPSHYKVGGTKFIFGYKFRSNSDFNRISESLNAQVWGFLLLILLCSLFFFHLGYYNFMVTKAFVFTVTLCVVVMVYGVSLIISAIGEIIKSFMRTTSFCGGKKNNLNLHYSTSSMSSPSVEFHDLKKKINAC
ncbi:hypothetical protein CYY_008563 [Polysphondylium violaceum]|uniref:Transmembrane protein n=1 Tax=Polysphondylium violaceum TaxID=133409 RepID=A0A8J4UX74_9MYCE|nr:hypothetical protein CYY_008563 [Polysphondylium violaceum]